MRKLPTLTFRKTGKPLIIKGSKWSDDGPLKKKTYVHIWQS